MKSKLNVAIRIGHGRSELLVFSDDDALARFRAELDRIALMTASERRTGR